MMGPIELLIILSLFSAGLLFGPGLIAVFVARHKGYRPWFWLFSAGLFGMFLILMKPNLQRATTPEERERWETGADWAGGILSGFTLFFMCAMPLFAVVGFVSFRTAAPVVTTTTITAPAQSDMQESAPAETTHDANTAPKVSENPEATPAKEPAEENPN